MGELPIASRKSEGWKESRATLRLDAKTLRAMHFAANHAGANADATHYYHYYHLENYHLESY